MLGSPSWAAWTLGLSRTIRGRLDAAGLSRIACSTLEATLYDRGEVPPEAAQIVADISALPCSPARFNAALERALRNAGASRHAPPERKQIRIAVPKVRVEIDEAHGIDELAEMEAANVRPVARRIA